MKKEFYKYQALNEDPEILIAFLDVIFNNRYAGPYHKMNRGQENRKRIKSKKVVYEYYD